MWIISPIIRDVLTSPLLVCMFFFLFFICLTELAKIPVLPMKIAFYNKQMLKCIECISIEINMWICFLFWRCDIFHIFYLHMLSTFTLLRYFTWWLYCHMCWLNLISEIYVEMICRNVHEKDQSRFFLIAIASLSIFGIRVILTSWHKLIWNFNL